MMQMMQQQQHMQMMGGMGFPSAFGMGAGCFNPMMNPMGSASWILCRIPWISMNPIGVSRRLLEGIPWGF